MNDIINRLQAFLDSARIAVSMAKIENPTARGMAGIGWKLPDGSGKLVSDFNSEPFCNDLEAVLDAHTNHQRELVEAHLRGALAMKAAIRDAVDESRDAIDEVSPPEFTRPDTGWRNRPPTLEEVKAVAQTEECEVWAGETQWMILQPTDMTVTVQIVTIREATYEADIKSALAQGATSFRPVTIGGDLFPWPILS